MLDNANQAKEVHELAPDLVIPVSASSQDAYDRLKSVGVPDDRMVAFVGVREPDSTYYTMLHDRKIMCILGLHPTSFCLLKSPIGIHLTDY